jgi:hypothetical protein
MNVTTLRDSVVGGTIVRAIWLLFAAVGLVLLIAAANVANLFSSASTRAGAKSRSAPRSAPIVRTSPFTISPKAFLLALIAAAGAIAIAWGLLHVVLAIAPQSLPASRRSLARLARRRVLRSHGAGVRARVWIAADQPDDAGCRVAS